MHRTSLKIAVASGAVTISRHIYTIRYLLDVNSAAFRYAFDLSSFYSFTVLKNVLMLRPLASNFGHFTVG